MEQRKIKPDKPPITIHLAVTIVVLAAPPP